jgi:hypothetical protein
MLTTAVRSGGSDGNDNEQPKDLAPLGWRARISSRFKRFAANTIHVVSTGVRIASEISIFTGGMAYIFTPLVRDMWRYLSEKSIAYSVTANGDLTANISFPLEYPIPINYPIPTPSDNSYNSVLVHQNLSNIVVSEKGIPFAMPYPEGIFVASVLLLSLGSAGIVLAHGLEKYGAKLLRQLEGPEPYSEALVLEAKKKRVPLIAVQTVLLIGSRGAALYATTTFNLMSALGNLAGIMNSFTIRSSQQFLFTPSEASLFLKVLMASLDITTFVGLDELKNAAIQGSNDINAHYTPWAYSSAFIALFLGFLELKAARKLDRYRELIQRHKHYSEFAAQRALPAPLPRISIEEIREPRPQDPAVQEAPDDQFDSIEQAVDLQPAAQNRDVVIDVPALVASRAGNLRVESSGVEMSALRQSALDAGDRQSLVDGPTLDTPRAVNRTPTSVEPVRQSIPLSLSIFGQAPLQGGGVSGQVNENEDDCKEQQRP